MLKRTVLLHKIFCNRHHFKIKMSGIKKEPPLKPPPAPTKELQACLSKCDPKKLPDTKCYEFPLKDDSNIKRYDGSVYEVKQIDLPGHKELSALKSAENVLPEDLEDGEITEKDTPLKEPPADSLKRSFSTSNLEDDKLEPKRKKICPHPPTDTRRKSFPSTPVALYRPHRADQTPYASPCRPFSRFSYDSSRLQDLDSECGFVDTHCHLDFLFDRSGYQGTFAEFKKEKRFPKCFKGCLAIFCNPHSFDKQCEWGRFLEEEDVWASFGCHPHNAADYDDRIEASLRTALQHPKVRALGEIGLDYSNRNGCPREQQFSAFRRQLRIALAEQLPVVIHCREAQDDGLRITQEVLPANHRIHLHCFTDTWDECARWLSAFPSLCVGLTSVLSYPSATQVRDVAERLPLHRLLLETDAPYFVPRTATVGRDTRHSHPGMAIHVAAQVAAIKRIPLEAVLVASRNNTRRIYNI